MGELKSLILCEGTDDKRVVEGLLTEIGAGEVDVESYHGKDQTGMIETLCLDVARENNPEAFECLDQYSECLKQKHEATLHEKQRFEIWTIAAQTSERPRRKLTFPRALQHLPFDWSHEKFSETRDVLSQIATDSSS